MDESVLWVEVIRVQAGCPLPLPPLGGGRRFRVLRTFEKLGEVAQREWFVLEEGVPRVTVKSVQPVQP